MTDNERTWEDDVMFRQAMGGLKELAPGLYDDIAAKIAALEAERDARGNLLALAAAEINCSGPVHERIRVLRRELTERAESAESRLAIAVEYIEDLEFNEADYEDNRWRRDATAAMEKERREALAQIEGKVMAEQSAQDAPDLPRRDERPAATAPAPERSSE